MIYLRSFLFECFFFAWTVFLAVLGCSVGLFTRRIIIWCGRAWGKGTTLLLRLLCGITIEIRGRQHIPEGACIVVSKHQSTLETLLFFDLLTRPVYSMKAELARIPLLGYMIRRSGAIPIKRGGGASSLRDLIKRAGEALEEGKQLIIFPEGTRAPPRTRGKYNPGAAAIYSRCDVPAIPVALNTGSFWGRRTLRKPPGRVIIEFLPAIEPGLERKAFQELLEDVIEEGTEKLERESPGH
tara:strand:+ start:391 stop:1110 length:720 start_codon:yes stop_codon:yes gene_type:complete